MPRVSKHAKLLSALRALIALTHIHPTLKRIFPFLPLLYGRLASRRYLTSRAGSAQHFSTWTATPFYSLDSYRARKEIRMDRTTYETLLKVFQRHPVFHHSASKQQQAPVQLQVQVFLYYIATSGIGGSHYTISQKFGISEGTVQAFVSWMLAAVISLRPRLLKWPSVDERRDQESRIETTSEFAGLVGFIDGTTFRLRCRPQLDGEAYFSRKSEYCVGAQLVCDDRRVVTAMIVGFPGSVHDSRQWQSMELCVSSNRFFPSSEYLLGDSAYGLSQRIIPLFKKPLVLQRRNKRFNYYLARQRITAEHKIGIIKERFGRLKNGFITVIKDVASHQYVVNMIEAGIILHNLCILHAGSHNDGCLLDMRSAGTGNQIDEEDKAADAPDATLDKLTDSRRQPQQQALYSNRFIGVGEN